MAIGDFHRADRLRAFFDLPPNFQSFEQLPRSGGDGGNALVARGLFCERRIADGNREVRLERARKCRGQGEPGDAGARDQDIEPFVQSVHRLASFAASRTHFTMKGGRVDCPVVASEILREPQGPPCRKPLKACSNSWTSSNWK